MVKPQGSKDRDDGGHCKDSGAEEDKRVFFAANSVFVNCGGYTVRCTTGPLLRGQPGF